MTTPYELPARVVLVGVRGFGQVHAARISELAERGLVRLVAAVDPGVEDETAHGVKLYSDLGDALTAVGSVDVVVIAAPLGEHFRLAETALGFGADVLLEKPPVAALADFERLLELERLSGRAVQVGFQSLGSEALPLILSDAYGIGPATEASAVGAWLRTDAYWQRSAWAGKRSLHGRSVVDGVVTNSLAHAVVTSLAVIGCRTAEDVAEVETDLYRANKIDCDDTSVVRITTTDGRRVTCALSLCAPEEQEPLVRLQGTQGRITFAYKDDRVDIETAGGTTTKTTGRMDLLENLVAHRTDGVALLVPLASTGAFMRVLDAVATADDPVKIDPHLVRWVGNGADRHPVVENVDHWLEEAATTGRTFAELGVPWAHRRRDEILVQARVANSAVATYRDGQATIPTSSPRPYLHPVRTLSGVVVSAEHPADHDWHLGVGVALPDVNGTSFWGGGTYVHGEGYVLLDNHGTVVGDPVNGSEDGFTQHLRWLDTDDSILLREERSVGWSEINPHTWLLSFATTLRADAGAVLNSPGSKGRVDGGYGGFFWRLPPCRDVTVFTADVRGEADVLGRTAPWVAWSAEFEAGPGISGPATIVLTSADAYRAEEPWFVRVASYPGVGSALAWEQPLTLGRGESWSRRYVAGIVDGRLDPDAAASLAASLLPDQ